jgi:CRP-like cAMP-binding protein
LQRSLEANPDHRWDQSLISSNMVDLETLNRAPLIGQLPLAARRVLATKAIVRRFASGQALWVAGDQLKSMAVVLDGRVRVVREGRGRQHVLHSEGPGGTLGEVPLFTDGPAPATALAIAPTRCLMLTRDTIEAAIVAEPAVAWLLLGRLADRVRTLVERVDRLALESVTTRLGGLVLAEVERTDSDVVALGMTQTALAAELGTVREVVVRALKSLRRDGVVEPNGRGRLRVMSRAKLRLLVAAGRG